MICLENVPFDSSSREGSSLKTKNLNGINPGKADEPLLAKLAPIVKFGLTNSKVNWVTIKYENN